jgi:hypothetical protein
VLGRIGSDNGMNHLSGVMLSRDALGCGFGDLADRELANGGEAQHALTPRGTILGYGAGTVQKLIKAAIIPSHDAT